MNTKRREKISFSENDINYIAYQMRQMNIKREDKNFFKSNQLQIGLLEEANEYQN